MDPHEADERYARIMANVSAARDLLQRVGEERWGGWLTTVHAELDALDAHGLKRLLSAYGGMGSLNDLMIHPVNGHCVPEEELDLVNRSFAELRSALYADATALHHDFTRSP